MMIHETPEFDDEGNMTDSVGFVYHDESTPAMKNALDSSAMRQEVMLAVLRYVSDGGANASEIGRRVLLLLHRIRPEDSQLKLAKRLGVSGGRASQLLKALRDEWPTISPVQYN